MNARKRTSASLIISIALLMESIDTTVINTAIPQMAHSFNVDPVNLKIALISYLLSLAIFIPISGWVADKFGAKRIFCLALSVFSISSFVCGLTSHLDQLVIWRFIQGCGGAFMLPIGRLIVTRIFKRRELINALTRIAIAASLGSMIGPTVGGIITHYFSWRWIFWINVPVGVITLLLSRSWLPNIASLPARPLDVLGFILFGSGLAGITFGLSALSESFISYFITSSILITSVLLLIAYFWYSRRQEFPIINIQLFQYRTFQISTLSNFFGRLSFGGIPFVVPLFLQITLGYSPQLAGLLLAPIAIGVAIGKPMVVNLLSRFGYKYTLIPNTLLISGLLWAFTLVNARSSPYFIAFLTLIFGLLVSYQYSGMNSLAYANIRDKQMGDATSFMGTLQQLSGSFGIAFCALLIHCFAKTPAFMHHLTISSFHQTFFFMGLLNISTLIIFLRLKQNDGAELLEVKPVKVADLAVPQK